jgi:cold shock protein
MAKLRGKVIWYSTTKGFGFISRPDGPDCFLHQAALLGRKTLPDGAEVEFDLSGTDGLHVDNVSPVTWPPPDSPSPREKRASHSLRPLASYSHQSPLLMARRHPRS